MNKTTKESLPETETPGDTADNQEPKRRKGSSPESADVASTSRIASASTSDQQEPGVSRSLTQNLLGEVRANVVAGYVEAQHIYNTPAPSPATQASTQPTGGEMTVISAHDGHIGSIPVQGNIMGTGNMDFSGATLYFGTTPGQHAGTPPTSAPAHIPPPGGNVRIADNTLAGGVYEKVYIGGTHNVEQHHIVQQQQNIQHHHQNIQYVTNIMQPTAAQSQVTFATSPTSPRERIPSEQQHEAEPVIDEVGTLIQHAKRVRLDADEAMVLAGQEEVHAQTASKESDSSKAAAKTRLDQRSGIDSGYGSSGIRSSLSQKSKKTGLKSFDKRTLTGSLRERGPSLNLESESSEAAAKTKPGQHSGIDPACDSSEIGSSISQKSKNHSYDREFLKRQRQSIMDIVEKKEARKPRIGKWLLSSQEQPLASEALENRTLRGEKGNTAIDEIGLLSTQLASPPLSLKKLVIPMSLKKLVMSGIEPTLETLEMFASCMESIGIRAEELDLSGSRLKKEMIPGLTQILQHCGTKKLGLQSCGLTPEVLLTLHQSLAGLELTELDVSDNADMGREGFLHLGEIVSQCGIKTLRLRECKLGRPWMMKMLKRCISGCELETLDVSGNSDLQPDGMALLGETVKQSRIKTLLLRDWALKTKKVEALGHSLQEYKLEQLDISRKIIPEQPEIWLESRPSSTSEDTDDEEVTDSQDELHGDNSDENEEQRDDSTDIQSVATTITLAGGVSSGKMHQVTSTLLEPCMADEIVKQLMGHVSTLIRMDNWMLNEREEHAIQQELDRAKTSSLSITFGRNKTIQAKYGTLNATVISHGEEKPEEEDSAESDSDVSLPSGSGAETSEVDTDESSSLDGDFSMVARFIDPTKEHLVIPHENENPEEEDSAASESGSSVLSDRSAERSEVDTDKIENGSESGTSTSSDGDFQMLARFVKGHFEVYEYNKILEHIENLDELEEFMNKHREGKYLLQLRITNMHFDREATEQLSRIIDGTEVIELSLLYCRITPDLLELLGQSESLSINSLSITQPGKIGELSDGIIKLAKISGTQRLSLMSNKMDKEDLDQLKDSLQKFKMEKLEALDVSYNEEMGEKGVEALGELLKICPVTELKMVQCNVADKELEGFRDILTKKGIKITDLDLSSNRSMTTQGYQTLAEIVRSAKVQRLRLSDVDLTADKINAFCATGNSTSQITKLDVGYNKDMGRVDLTALEGAVHHWGIEEISLAGCRLNDEQLRGFCNSIMDRGHKMKALSIADNHLSCDAMVDVAELVRKCGIVDLDMSNCMLTSSHIPQLRNALQEAKLSSLDLSVHGQVLTEAFIESVCNLLPKIKNRLYLRSRKLPIEHREMLQKYLDELATTNLQIVSNDCQLRKHRVDEDKTSKKFFLDRPP